MSQKPRTGEPAKLAASAKAAKEAASKTVRTEPATIPVAKADSAAKPGLTPVSEATSVAIPAKSLAPVVTSVPVAESEPLMQSPSEAANVPSPESIAPVKPPILKPVAVASENMTTAAHSVSAVTAKAVKAAASIEPTRPSITQGMKTMMKSTEELVAFGQANMEAFVKSGQIWSAGVQELTKQIATSAKASFDESVSTLKAISTARSVKEAIDLQSTFAKAALEKAVAESNKITDASIKLTEQTLAPITARVTVAVESFGKTH
jgi:phasin family protein